jgi:hypothetical protein
MAKTSMSMVAVVALLVRIGLTAHVGMAQGCDTCTCSHDAANLLPFESATSVHDSILGEITNYSHATDWQNAVAALRDRATVLQDEWAGGGGFVAATHVVPEPQLEAMLIEALRPDAFSNSHRKGILAPAKSRSVPYGYILENMPTVSALYDDPDFILVLEQISGRSLQLSHASDPHAMVLYYYTEPGDFIGWHYDSSFYHGERFTALIPLFDNSSCRLDIELPGLAGQENFDADEQIGGGSQPTPPTALYYST